MLDTTPRATGPHGLLYPAGAIDAGPARDGITVRFASRLELARMPSLPQLARSPEPVSIGRGWLLQMVRARRAATGGAMSAAG